MTHEEARRLIPVPELHKLKQIALGIEIDLLFGTRILVECIEPHTKMDSAYKNSGIVIPATVKKDNTPMPSTGIVMGLGAEVKPDGPIKVGSMVMFSKHSGTEFVFTDDDTKQDSTKRWRILDIDEIVCTLRSNNNEGLMSKIVPVTADDTAPDVMVVKGQSLLG